ncbi:MAG TPA: nuclear transport factor 2 family protein [Solirubrobacteraceae bacterium]|nr:nuclear transport factor 2 family protein [Solirubrobacteraceae bacterium]
MATLEQTPTDIAAATTARYRKTAEAGDIDGLLATLSPDVVFHSPITERAVFRGHDEMRELLEAVFDTFTEIRYFLDIGDDRTRSLAFRGLVGRQPVEESVRIELDDQGRITDLTAYFRPLPALTKIAATLVPKIIARRHGRLLGTVVKAAMLPLAVITRLADRLVPHLL